MEEEEVDYGVEESFDADLWRQGSTAARNGDDGDDVISLGGAEEEREFLAIRRSFGIPRHAPPHRSHPHGVKTLLPLLPM